MYDTVQKSHCECGDPYRAITALTLVGGGAIAWFQHSTSRAQVPPDPQPPIPLGRDDGLSRLPSQHTVGPSRLDTQALANFRYDAVGRLGNFNSQSLFRLLKIRKLAGENLSAGKVSRTHPQALCDQVGFSMQENELNLGSCHQLILIASFQRRTGQHSIPAPTDPVANDGVKPAQPGTAVIIGKWNALPDLLNIGSGVIIVCVGELPAELLGK